MDESYNNDLGPLPKADRNSELQQLSIAAFRSSLPPDKFRFRDERSDDAGVDGSLELLSNGFSTNLRSQIQLKGTDSADGNSDGSISVSVKVSNLNYLLNGPSPIYILYQSARNELRFVWARDERKRLDQSSPGWMEQTYVTIRFSERITGEALEIIHKRIAREAQFQRRINDLLDFAKTDHLTVSIDPTTREITDHKESTRIVLESGHALVTAGYGKQVEGLIRMADPKDVESPHILLVHAHAEYSLGQYQSCIALLMKASLSFESFSPEDKLFLQTLRDSCDYQIGRITMAELAQRLEQRTRGDESRFGLSNRLSQIRYAFYSENTHEGRAARLTELRSLVREIVNAPDKAEALKIHARIQLVEVEGTHLVLNFVREMGDFRLKLTFGRPPDLKQILYAESEGLANWEKEANEVFKDATALGSPLLIAVAMITQGTIAYLALVNELVLSIFCGCSCSIQKNLIERLIDNAFQAVELLHQSGALEAELRGKMLLADLYGLLGREKEAQKVANEVLPIATIMEYSNLISRAKEHISKQSLLSQLAETARPRSEKEKVFINAKMTNEELQKAAAQSLKLLELPVERLPVLERDYASCREIAREKIDWCAQIDLIQDKSHELQHETLYRTDPVRFCVCLLYNHQSILGNPDYAAVISAFKKSYCESCRDRTPLK